MSHLHEKIDFVVNAFIVHDQKVLLIHHKQIGRWLPIGGHIELDESPDEAVFREIQEECGLAVEILAEKVDSALVSGEDNTQPLYRPSFVDIHDINKSHRHISFNYIFTTEDETLNLAEDEHNEIRWLSREEIEDPLYDFFPRIKYYALKALETAGS